MLISPSRLIGLSMISWIHPARFPAGSCLLLCTLLTNHAAARQVAQPPIVDARLKHHGAVSRQAAPRAWTVDRLERTDLGSASRLFWSDRAGYASSDRPRRRLMAFDAAGKGRADAPRVLPRLPSKADSSDWNWADDTWAQSPNFAESKRICRRLRNLEPPAADWPDRKTAATLSGCDSEALYLRTERLDDDLRERPRCRARSRSGNLSRLPHL